MIKKLNYRQFAPLCLGAMALLASLGSCSTDNDSTPEPEFLQLSTDTLIFTGAATQQSFEIESTGKSWAIEISEAGKAWLTVTPPTGKSGTTTITVKPGEYANDFTRFAYLLVGKEGATPSRIGISQSGATHASSRLQDSLSLAAIYNATRGAEWTGGGRLNSYPWAINRPITEWSGVTTELINGELRVTGLNLSRVSGMKGELPNDIGYLSELTELSISADELTGKIPVQIALLSKLTDLQISAQTTSHATWEITEEYKRLTNLESLTIGSIEPEEISKNPLALIYQLNSLKSLTLNLPYVSGTMASGISALSNLEKLNLRMPNITALPTDMGELSSLKELTLSAGRVTALPSDLTKWSSLEELTISAIRNTLQLPASFKNLVNLKLIDFGSLNLAFDGNELFANMSKLERLYLSYNRISGSIDWLAGKPNLEMMQIDQNEGAIHGEIPAQIYGYSNLNYFVISSATTAKNLISGTLGQIDQLTNLQVFALPNATLTGSLNIPNSESLNIFDVSENNLTGSVENLTLHESIVSLKLFGNRLSGTLPQQFADLFWDYNTGEPPMWSSFLPADDICPQQAGYGFTNCWSFSVNP